MKLFLARNKKENQSKSSSFILNKETQPLIKSKLRQNESRETKGDPVATNGGDIDNGIVGARRSSAKYEL